MFREREEVKHRSEKSKYYHKSYPKLLNIIGEFIGNKMLTIPNKMPIPNKIY